MVVNPTKVADVGALRADTTTAMLQAGWQEPMWLETTAEDPGYEMTRRAVEEGVDVVVACGGDGTVRACAQILAGTHTPIAVLPLGTGNLLARNLNIPTDQPGAMAVITDGRDRTIDLGCADDRNFTVMCGLGFDAAMLDGASETAKKRFGWMAYTASGVRQLRRQRFVVTVTADGQAPTRHRCTSILVANLGTLTGGLELLPDAVPDDGRLDVALITPANLRAWVALGWHVIRRKEHDRPGAIERFRVRKLEISTRHQQPMELDGDPVESTHTLTVTVRPSAIRIRVPVVDSP
jgi:YegS/Rv2252/BmrU family lipid kinase